MSPEQIFQLIAALTAEPGPEAFATLKAGGADPAYPVTVAACPRPVAPTEIDGTTVICGTIEMPLDHRAPDGPTINIAFNLPVSRDEGASTSTSMKSQPDASCSLSRRHGFSVMPM